MDDKEYYSLMNRPSSYFLQQELKKNQLKKNKTDTGSSASVIEKFHDIEVRQGNADAEMLLEKKQE